MKSEVENSTRRIPSGRRKSTGGCRPIVQNASKKSAREPVEDRCSFRRLFFQ